MGEENDVPLGEGKDEGKGHGPTLRLVGRLPPINAFAVFRGFRDSKRQGAQNLRPLSLITSLAYSPFHFFLHPGLLFPFVPGLCLLQQEANEAQG